MNLVVIPSYQDLTLALKLARKITKNDHIKKVMIIDDVDEFPHTQQIVVYEDEKLIILRRRRLGKWSIWPLAFNYLLSTQLEGLIEINADVELRNIEILLEYLYKGYDVITSYSHFRNVRNSPFGSIVNGIYNYFHRYLAKEGIFALGGEVIALSRKAIKTYIKLGLLEEPIVADDYVVSIAAPSLGLKYISVDCGLFLSLPCCIKEYFIYRNRFNEMKSIFRYLERKIPKSKFRYWYHYDTFYKKIMIKSILKMVLQKPLYTFVFTMILFLSSLFPMKEPHLWPRLHSEKPLFKATAVEP